MNQFETLKDFSILFNDVNSKKISFHNILIGNGLGLSHPNPKVSKAFAFVAKNYVDTHLIKALSSQKIDCPEKFLEKS